MYLKLICIEIKTGRWKVGEVSKIAYLGHLGLKQVGKIVCVGIKTSKMVYAWFEAGRIKAAGERLII